MPIYIDPGMIIVTKAMNRRGQRIMQGEHTQAKTIKNERTWLRQATKSLSKNLDHLARWEEAKNRTVMSKSHQHQSYNDPKQRILHPQKTTS